MSELNLQELFLNWIVSYGEPMLAVVLLLGALGLPMPGTLMVIASGAFVRQGILDMVNASLFGLLGAVSGDTIVYGVGRVANVWIARRFGQSASWQKAHAFFERRGGIAIYLTRWLLTPFAVPTNLIAGSSGYPFWKLSLFGISGEMTWIILYGGLGYAFGSQWELISDFISNFTGLIVGVFVLGLGLYFAFRSRK
jgi:membrane protein DedA with SNARE-associated domain